MTTLRGFSTSDRWAFDIEQFKFLDNWMQGRENALMYGNVKKNMTKNELIAAIATLEKILLNSDISHALFSAVEDKLLSLIKQL